MVSQIWDSSFLTLFMGRMICFIPMFDIIFLIQDLSHLLKTTPFLVDNHDLRNRKSLITNNIIFPLLH